MKTIRIVVDLGCSELQLTLTERAVKEVEMNPTFLQTLKEKVLKEVRETQYHKLFYCQKCNISIVRLPVSSKQAMWAEYLLLRSHKFMLMSKPKNKRNLEWATKHNVMPESWNGKPLIEIGCKEGLKGLKNNGKRKM